MALAETLKALRDMVLFSELAQLNMTERADLLKTRYPALAESERLELAAIPQTKLQTYTDSIYSGYHSFFKRRFPKTFKRLSATTNSYNFIVSAHRDSPLTRHDPTAHGKLILTTVLRFADSVKDYLLADLVRFEYEVFRLTKSKILEPSYDLSQNTVGDFLALRIKIHPQATLHEFMYDLPCDGTKSGRFSYYSSLSRSFQVRWTAAEHLKPLTTGGEHSLESLYNTETIPSLYDPDENIAFKKFFDFAVKLLHDRVIVAIT